MQETLLDQGINLLTYGMGTVFVFLTLLVVSVKVMSSVISRFFAEAEPAPAPAVSVAKPSVAPTTAVDPKTLLVIQDAIYQHRAKHLP